MTRIFFGNWDCVFVCQWLDYQLEGSLYWPPPPLPKAFQHYFFTPSNNGQREQRLSHFSTHPSGRWTGSPAHSCEKWTTAHFADSLPLSDSLCLPLTNQPQNHRLSQAKIGVDFPLNSFEKCQSLIAGYWVGIRFTEQGNRWLPIGETRAGRYPCTILSGARAQHNVFINTCSKM